MPQREQFERAVQDAAPAYELAERLRNDPPAKGRERYSRAAREVAAKYNISVRTLERRAKEYRPFLSFDLKYTDADVKRLMNYFKSKIAAGEGDQPCLIPQKLIPKAYKP